MCGEPVAPRRLCRRRAGVQNVGVTAAPHEPFRVVFVCTGNICRSPMADVVFRWLAEAAGLGDRVVSRSAGTGGLARRRARRRAHARGPSAPRSRAHPARLGSLRGRCRQGRAPALLRPVRRSAGRARSVLCRSRNVRRGARYDRERKPLAVPAARTGDPPRAPLLSVTGRQFVPALPPQPLSPLDGRYRAQVADLADHLSEAGLNRARVEVEVEWLIALTDRSLFGTSPLSADDKTRLRALYEEFGADEIAWLADKEAVTRHDVKAVEYLVRDRLERLGLSAIAELTHFACTSEDINSASYALTVRRAVLEVWLPRLRAVTDSIRSLADRHRDAAMLARTHGQPATPTTMAKSSPCSPGVSRGAEPDVDWPELSRSFIEGLGIGFNPLTTQIESHDWQVELYDRIRHAGGILHNLATDVWTYISLGYFSQIPVAGATGSSTMPHKINPIRFENAEANLEISGGLLSTLAATLVTSRLQRDLTDSTTQRNIGVALGHSLLALDNLQRGLGEISLAEDVLLADLDANWEVLAEAIQTVVRAEIAAAARRSRSVRAAEGAHPRPPRGRRGAGRVRRRARHRGCRQAASARPHPPRPTSAWRRAWSTWPEPGRPG
ncbi:hypothetical protein LUZ63_021701 [Rhynchospora breviuscula]|uniref:Adenylosuccinate lyase n=1 Tax=Rhynchospora breviuscula TaxID=2022672 RepID=A0A9Q0BYF7_9POAL|nr:hypothetical protein LUZ63_021701 [Rhynchospora breviuscula]